MFIMLILGLLFGLVFGVILGCDKDLQRIILYYLCPNEFVVKELKNVSSKRSIVVYVSGKYTGKMQQMTKRNIEMARKHAMLLWNAGFTVICPHLNAAEFELYGEKYKTDISYDDLLLGSLHLLKKCDYIYLLSNWRQSKGARLELQYAKQWNIPVFSWSNKEFIKLKNANSTLVLQELDSQINKDVE